jgi:hypothetical protein
MKYYLVLLTLFFSFALFAQHETDQRVIGFQYIMKFNGNNPFVETNSNAIFYNPNDANYKGTYVTPNANSICDTLGNLLFYYDGVRIYNADKTIMQNGTLHDYNFSSSYTSSLIVPIEESNRRVYYFIETIPHQENWDFVANTPINCPINSFCSEFRDNCLLVYHVIDMSLNQGRGGVRSKNIIIEDSIAPSISGVKHANNIDTWLTVLKSRTNIIKNFKINACGISDPIFSQIPDFEYPDKPYLTYTKPGLNLQFVYSPSGNMVALTGTKKSENTLTKPSYAIFLAPFDDATGTYNFGDMQTIAIFSSFCLNLFSHDSKYFYYNNTVLFVPIWIYQFDVTTGMSTPFYYNGTPANNSFQAMDYGKNNDIIFHKINTEYNIPAMSFSGYLGKLNNISQTYVTANLIDSLLTPSFPQPPIDSRGSPNYTTRNNYIYNFYHPNYKKPAAFAQVQSIADVPPSPTCFTNAMSLKALSTIAADSSYWLVKNNTALTWQKIYADTTELQLQPGTYQANYVSYKYCISDTAETTFVIDGFPHIQLPMDTVYTCDNKSVPLPNASPTSPHIWTNAVGAIVTENTSIMGQYTIQVSNTCGAAYDSLFLENSTLELTNLITANKDGLNDCLITIQNNPHETMRLAVYNSWGSLVFLSEMYNNDWCPTDLTDGIYFVEVSYNTGCYKKGWLQVLH